MSWQSNTGPLVYVALGFGVVGGLLAVLAAFGIGFAKWRFPMTVGWLGFTLAVVTSSIGAILARSNFTHAMTAATAEVKQSMLAAAIAENLFSQIGLLMVLSAAFLLFCLAACIPTAIAVGDDPRFDLRGLLSAVGGAVAGLVTALIGVVATIGLSNWAYLGPGLVLIPLMTLLVTLAVVVASVRVSDSSRVHQGRVAASRIAVGVAGALAVVLTGYLFTAFGTMAVFEAVARASADSKAELLRVGLEIAAYSQITGWCFGLIPLFASIASVLHIVGRIEGRQWAGMVVATVQTLVILAGVLFVAGTTKWMFNQLVGTF